MPTRKNDESVDETAYLLRSAANANRLIEEIEDLRIEAVARARLLTPRKAYLSKKDVDSFVESL